MPVIIDPIPFIVFLLMVAVGIMTGYPQLTAFMATAVLALGTIIMVGKYMGKRRKNRIN